MAKRITRRAFVKGAGAGSFIFLLGNHSAPQCVRFSDARRFSALGGYTFTHLTRSC
jgi:hypothetical protein